MAKNRFDLIRLVLALAVFAYHGVVLSAMEPFGTAEHMLGITGELRVQAFFIVSGTLVSLSLSRSKGLLDFAGKRIRRVYPAYVVVILIPAIAALVMGADWSGVARYFGANLIFMNFLSPNLPGLFGANRFTEVNGALWTLKIEVMFYFALPVIFGIMHLLGKRASWAFLVLLYAGGVAWRYVIPLAWDHPYAEEVARQLPGQMAYFATGIAMWRLWDWVRVRPWLCGLAGAVLLAASLTVPWLEPLRALGLAGVIAFVAFVPGWIPNVARFGDVSYGLYITHFPILQALTMVGLFAAIGYPAGFAVSFVLVLAVSYLLWYLVEKPSLRRSSHYRRVETKPALAVSGDPAGSLPRPEQAVSQGGS